VGHDVRTHTRRLPSGRTVTVRRHARRQDGPAGSPLPEKDQDRRDRFEQRALRERQAQRKAARTGKQPARTPGARKARSRGPKPARARRHARKARRLWRRHKVRAVLYGAAALGEVTAWLAWRGSARTRKAVRGLRRKRS